MWRTMASPTPVPLTLASVAEAGTIDRIEAAAERIAASQTA